MASPLQFSVRQLLIAIAFVAVGIVALRNANFIGQGQESVVNDCG